MDWDLYPTKVIYQRCIFSGDVFALPETNSKNHLPEGHLPQNLLVSGSRVTQLAANRSANPKNRFFWGVLKTHVFW